jgi:ubiquinone/menaquinone biosynthesis C-methylase UbiE
MLAACIVEPSPADGAHVLDIACGLGKFTDARIDPDIGRKAL